jgi:hypothetical protein
MTSWLEVLAQDQRGQRRSVAGSVVGGAAGDSEGLPVCSATRAERVPLRCIHSAAAQCDNSGRSVPAKIRRSEEAKRDERERPKAREERDRAPPHCRLAGMSITAPKAGCGRARRRSADRESRLAGDTGRDSGARQTRSRLDMGARGRSPGIIRAECSSAPREALRVRRFGRRDPEARSRRGEGQEGQVARMVASGVELSTGRAGWPGRS